jgi:predicted phosphoadenosine phosphosulfate sulfurtransferase
MAGTSHVRPRIELDKNVYDLALERTAYVMDVFDEPIVAFSGGKDSTAVLNIALEVAHSSPRYRRHLPLRIVHWDEEAIPYETEEYVRRIAQRDDVALDWFCLPVQHRNACSRTHPYWWPWAPEDRAKWCRPLPPEAITHLDGFPLNPPKARPSAPAMNGLLAPGRASTVMLMGIRAQESITRTRAVSRKAVDNYIVPYKDGPSNGNLSKAYTIYDWRTEDVWTAPAFQGWDYNRAYDRMEMAGVSATQQRCSPAFGEEPLQKIHTYATCFPDVWERMSERVPGIGAAYRYALTELYCYRDRPEKPTGMTWPDFLAHYVAKFTPEAQAKVSDRLRLIIRRHYRKTTDPIVVKAKHPETGVSWDYLLMIAMRGDFKNRKQEGAGFGVPMPRLWNRYASELARLIDAGAGPELGHPRPLPGDPYALVPPVYRAGGQDPRDGSPGR